MRGRNGDLDLVGLPRLHVAQDVVGDAAGAHMQAVRVQVGRIEVIRQVVIVRLGVAIGRQVVDQVDAQHVAGPRAQRGAGRMPS